MLKIAEQKLDVVDEILGGDPTLLCEVIDSMPDIVKNAHIPSVEEQENFDKRDVALILQIHKMGSFKKFAHNSAALTQINSNLLAVKAPTLPDEVVKTASYFLKRASKRWNVPFPEFLEKYAETGPQSNIVHSKEIDEIAWAKKIRNYKLIAKQAELDSMYEHEFALPLERKYPIKTVEQIKTAAGYFDSYFRDMSLGDRLTFSRNLHFAASTKDVPIVGEFEKYASLDLNSFGEDIDRNIDLRIKMAPLTKPKIATTYASLKARKDEFGPMKTAALLEAIDEQWNGSRFYGKYFEDPLLSSLRLVKIAALEIDGRIITKDQINKVAEKGLSDIVDRLTTSELAGDDALDTFRNLPLPARAAIYELCH